MRSHLRSNASRVAIVVVGKFNRFLRVRSIAADGYTGELSIASTYDELNTTGVAVTALDATAVPLADLSRDVHALAFVGEDLALHVEVFELTGTGHLSRRGAGTSLPTLSPTAQVRVAPYTQGGVFVHLQADADVEQQSLQTWALDPSPTSSAITPVRIAFESVFQDGVLGLCQAPTDDAEGDFLLAYGGDKDGLLLQAYRSAAR